MLESDSVDQVAYDEAELLAARLNSEEKDPDDLEVEAGAHPEGRKRGGTVSVYTEGDARVFYDETACEWFGYDDLDE